MVLSALLVLEERGGGYNFTGYPVSWFADWSFTGICCLLLFSTTTFRTQVATVSEGVEIHISSPFADKSITLIVCLPVSLYVRLSVWPTVVPFSFSARTVLHSLAGNHGDGE